MNKKVTPLSIFNFILLFIPWTIFIIRDNPAALESPVAEITIAAYSIFIIVAFIFTLIQYNKKQQRDILTNISLVVNGIYTAGVVVLGCTSIASWVK